MSKLEELESLLTGGKITRREFSRTLEGKM